MASEVCVDSVLFPNIIHFQPDINDHKSDTYLIVLFAVSKFLGLIVFRLRDFSRPNEQNNLSFWSSFSAQVFCRLPFTI